MKKENYFEKVSEEILKLKNQELKILQISKTISNLYKSKNKILIAGNGGSNADSEHFAGELVCTFSKKNRKPISAISLGANNSALTAWGNDFSFESYFERQVLAHGKKNDLLFLISTGGGSKSSKASMNLVHACRAAKKQKMKTFSLIGKSGGILKNISDNFILIDNNTTSIIQECHMSIIHSICMNLDNLIK